MPTGLDLSVPYEDAAHLRFENTLFGEQAVAIRRDRVSAHFAGLGLVGDKVEPILQYDISVSGGWNQNERLLGGTSNSVSIVEAISGTKAKLRCIQGAITSGETLTGIGTTATLSASARTVTRNAAANGDVTVSNAVATIQGGTNTDSEVALESNELAPYAAGHQLQAYFTAGFGNAAAGATQYIGPFSPSGRDGYAIGYKNGTFGFFVRRNSVEITFVARTSWNIDPLDGTGPSGSTFSGANFDNLWIWGMKIGYLGIAGCILYLIDATGRWWPVHRYNRIGTGNEVTIYDPHMVMRAEVVKTSGAGTPLIRTASWNIATLGPSDLDSAPERTATFSRLGAALTSGAERYVCTIANKILLSNGLPNASRIKIEEFSGYSDATVANWASFRLVKNAAPNTSSSWLDVDATQSCALSDIASTAGISTVFGKTILAAGVTSRGAGRFLFDTNPVFLMPGESLTVLVTLSANCNVSAFLRWKEGT